MSEGAVLGSFTSVTRDRGHVAAVVDASHAAVASRGHFPGEPLLPGTALLELMVGAARALRAPDDRLAAVERAVFRRRVRPSDHIVVTAGFRDPSRVAAAVLANGAMAAVGVLRFEAA